MPSLVFDIVCGEIVTGAWCPHCLLPSMIEFPMFICSQGQTPTPDQQPTTIVRQCADCGRCNTDLH